MYECINFFKEIFVLNGLLHENKNFGTILRSEIDERIRNPKNVKSKNGREHGDTGFLSAL